MGNYVIVKFTNIIPGKNYSLYYKPELSGGAYRFEDMPFYKMFPNNDKSTTTEDTKKAEKN
jgi:hypothetical protein